MGVPPDEFAGLKQLYRRLVLLLVGVFLMVSIAWAYFVIYPSPFPSPLMTISGSSTTDDPVCPGDTLPYTVTFQVTEPGVYAVDVSVWRVSPPATVLFSDARRMVLTEQISYTIAREWVIPATYPDPTINLPVAWLPGRYERRHAISTVSRATKPSMVSIPFTIAKGCQP